MPHFHCNHLDVFTLPIPHLPKLSHPSPPMYIPPLCEASIDFPHPSGIPLPWRLHLPLASVPEVLTPKNSLSDSKTAPGCRPQAPAFLYDFSRPFRLRTRYFGRIPCPGRQHTSIRVNTQRIPKPFVILEAYLSTSHLVNISLWELERLLLVI